MNKRGRLALTQIFILLINIIAFSYFINEKNFVSAIEETELNTPGAMESDISPGAVEKIGSLTSEEQKSLTALRKKIGQEYGKGHSSSQIPHGYAGKLLDWFKISTAKGTWGFSASGIIQGATWALAVYGAVKMVGPMFGLSPEQTNAAATALGMGVFAGKTALSLFGEGGVWANNAFIAHSGLYTFGIGLAVAAVVYYLTYKKVETQIVKFDCYPWDASTGGANCEKCNQQRGLPCSEYQCRSLGQACELVNPNTDEARCIWKNKNDVNFPIIQPMAEALLPDYSYKPDNTISPPDSGVKIWNSKNVKGCAPAFTPISFGVTLDEPAKCKIDFLRKQNYTDMDYYFGGSSLLRYNHTQTMALPGPNSTENNTPILQNGGNFEIYTRCEDANGNKNLATFVFKFCVDDGPDTTPPIIVATNILNNKPIAYNTTSVDLEVYTNEPSSCKWSHLNQDYDKMETQMSCISSVLEMNAQMLYKCTTTLTGLKNQFDNKFYFRCEDKPLAPIGERNKNKESYSFTLIGTQPLILDEAGPNDETIRDSTDVVKVKLTAKTSAGYKDGESICYYSDTGEDKSYIMFYNTNSYTHSQELWLAEGDYKYYIKCLDLGGNTDEEIINFKVETDTLSPIVVRAFHDSSYLKIITNEKSECVYGNTNCNYPFDDGISLTTYNNLEHLTDWNSGINFYIKCRDIYENPPAPDECSIIARPSEV